jgi:hypothetical protein
MTEYRVKALASAEQNITAIENKLPFKRCFDDIEETFRTKKQLIKILGMACTFCPYKLPCWGSKLQLLPQQLVPRKEP